MKALRWSLIVLAALVALLVLAALLVTELINPDAYRGQIERLVARDTGRPLRIEGHLRLGWYPWLTLEIGPARLGNRTGLRGPDLLAWRSARVPVRLLPLLLHRRIELGTIELDGADIHLWRSAAGVGNWQNLLTTPSAPATSTATPSIGGLVLRDATLVYTAGSASLELRQWQLHLGAWAPGRPISLSTRFVLRAPHVPPGGVPVRFSVRRLRVQSSPLRVRTPQWMLTVASAALSGALRFTAGRTGPDAAGTVALTVPSVRALIGTWGLKMRLPKDPSALGALSLSTRWRLGGGTVRLAPLSARLDATSLTGWASGSLGAHARWRFGLAADQVDFDDYLPPTRRHPKPLKLPLARLRALPLQGTLTVERAIIAGTRMRALELRVQ